MPKVKETRLRKGDTIKCNDGRLFHAPTSDFRKIR